MPDKHTQDDAIHQSVRERYAAIARNIETTPASCAVPSEDNVSSVSCCSPTPADSTTSTASCCGTSTATSSEVPTYAAAIYEDTSLTDLPESVTGLSLGCGDPIGIASLNAGETVLDLGSGGGIDCFLAAERVGETGHVIGVDMTPEMLERANANKERLGVKNVEFRQGYIEDLPVDDNSIDVILSNCVINLSPDKAAVFREAFRVLRSGGRVSISDIVTEGHFSEEQRADAASWSACLTGAIDVNDYVQLMRDAGFVDIEVNAKAPTEDIAEMAPENGPTVYSARITARKP